MDSKKETNLLKELLEQSIPWVESYYKSRKGTDWKTGQNEVREKWIEQVKETLKGSIDEN